MIIQSFTPLKLYWVSPQFEIYDLSQDFPLTDKIFSTGRFLALYKLDGLEGTYQLNDVTYIKQSTDKNFNIPDGRLGIRLKSGFSNTDFPFTKAVIIDALRTEGFNLNHGSLGSGVVGDETYQVVDRDLYIEVPKNFDRSNLVGFVNGIYHDTLTDPNSNGVFLRDGYHTLREERGNPSVNMIDFSPLGGVKVLKIKKEWIITDLNQLHMGGIFHIPDYNLQEYTVCLINDGRLYFPGEVLKVTGSKSLNFDTGPLKTYTDFYRSPSLRKNKEFPIDSDVLNKSDAKDEKLAYWVDTVSQPVGDLLTADFVLQRLLSSHSAILLLPKGTMFSPYLLQQFDEEPNTWVYPKEVTQNNSVLISNGLVTTPVYIKTGSRMDRSFIYDPMSSDYYDDPQDDPLRKVEYSPDRAMNKVRYKQRVPKLCSILRFSVTD